MKISCTLSPYRHKRISSERSAASSVDAVGRTRLTWKPTQDSRYHGTFQVSPHSSHPAAKSSEPVPPQIFQLLYFALAACKPQKKRQAVKQVLLPFGHRGTQLHAALAARFEHLLTRKGTQPAALMEFHKQADSLHSVFRSAKRNTTVLLAEDVSHATGKSIHFLSRGRIGVEDVYPKTKLCTEAEWNSHLALTGAHEEALTKHMQRAWEQRERLVLDDEDEDGYEMDSAIAFSQRRGLSCDASHHLGV